MPAVLLAVWILLAGSVPSTGAGGQHPAAAVPRAADNAVQAQGGLLFGLGSQAYRSLENRLVQEAPVSIITSWFSFRTDMEFFDIYRTAVTPQIYAAGKAMHLVIWDGYPRPGAPGGSPDGIVQTKYGPVCGEAYPLSREFQADMVQLAKNTGGAASGPPLYVSMFTEFQTYPCREDGNYWDTGQAYYRALKDAYLEAKDTFHQFAPNSRVALTWGGWAATFDDPARGGGRSMLPHFKDVMDDSDFQSFQAMGNHENVEQTTWMVKTLHGYGNGLSLLAHYNPDNNSLATYDADMVGFFNDAKVAELKANGLFGFSFMGDSMLGSSEARYQQAKAAIIKYHEPVPPWPPA
ncbi:hypothetical protein NMQ03_16120 [Arthrobacter sp. DNA4]|uniref:hypothetical protein n=1 Tax=Micrococcaceae TaxID=1268 RepID=UPI0020CC9255|nr:MULTISPECIES: hypothetical protein [Micrococcaceae]UTT68736.1 hypothetical protein NMQ03_16120 [Arthrobacter sp. DNA4]WRT12983.1 hypothetical protein VIK36_16725 [Pseudarthrobacter sp. LT1]